MLTLDKGEDTDEVNTDVDTFVDTCTPSSSHPAVFNLSHLSHDSHHITFTKVYNFEIIMIICHIR